MRFIFFLLLNYFISISLSQAAPETNDNSNQLVDNTSAAKLSENVSEKEANVNSVDVQTVPPVSEDSSDTDPDKEAASDQKASVIPGQDETQVLEQTGAKIPDKKTADTANTNVLTRTPSDKPVATDAQEAQSKKIVSRLGRRNSVETDQQTIIAYIDQLTQLNRKMSELEDDRNINKLLDKENQVLTDLIAFLRSTQVENLPPVANRKELNFLASRIAINEERENELAVQRDQAKLAYYKTAQGIRDYIDYLIQASLNYKSFNDIVDYTEATRSAFEQVSKQMKPPAKGISGNVAAALNENYAQFEFANDTFKDILDFVITNPRLIASTHWFHKFSLLSAISFVNSFDIFKQVNRKLSPLRVDAGGIIVSLAIFALVFLSYPFLFKCTSWFCENYILDKDSENDELIYRELRKPVRVLLVFFGIHLATYALLYKSAYKGEHFTFIVYTIIAVWFLFQVLDSVVVAHFEEISKVNKALRKDLVKLGIQLAKFVIFISALAVLLSHFGVSITGLMSTLGIGGVAFAFAAKDSIANLFGGMTILFDNMFKMGDWVSIGDVEGTVAEIGLRSTTVRTFDNALVTVPNSLISVASVINWNRRAVGRRIKMYIGVTYESNMDDIRQALEDIRAMLLEHPDIANPKQKVSPMKRQFRFSSHADTQGIKSTQLVFLDRYNDFSIDILLYCFSRTVNWAEWLAVKEDVLFKIADILKNNNLQFAYPTQVEIHRLENPRPDELELTMQNQPA